MNIFSKVVWCWNFNDKRYQIKKEPLQKFALKLNSEKGTSKRITGCLANNTNLEDAMHSAVTQRRSLRVPISTLLICEKALDYSEKLGVSEKL